MPTKTLNEMIKGVRDLPSLPTIVIDLLSCIDQDEAGSKTLGEKISLDQALTAKTLRIANSSFYGMPRKVSTIQQAISILGFDSVRTLVSSVAMTSAFPTGKSGRVNLDTFWQESIASAICAKILAKHLRTDPGQAFVAGLLHDIGRLILALDDPERYGQVLDYQEANKCHIRLAENAIFGFEHTEVGRALAECWKLPLIIQTAIITHHEPILKKGAPLGIAIQAADKMMCALVVNGEESQNPESQDSCDVWKSLGISEKAFQDMLEGAKTQFGEISGFLVH